MVLRFRAGWIAAGILVSSNGLAHSVKQKAGAYADNQGRGRQRMQTDLGFEGKGSGTMTASGLSVSAGRDKYIFDDQSASDYNSDIYGSPTHLQTNLSVSASQTWKRMTDTRVLAAYSTDGKVKTRTFGGGFSQWMFRETLRVSYDLSRTILEQPEYRFLDYDSQEVGNPTGSSSVGSTIALRHLASTTTIMDYSVSRIENESRPVTNSATAGIREFFPKPDGALHTNVTRAYNRGYIGTDTTYGQVDAWSFETAWLQNLWTGASGRASYRYYKEDETTRAYEDEKVFGSDMYSVSMIQQIGRKAVDSIRVPIQIEAGAAKYLTNVGVAANSYEMAVSAKF